MKRKKYKLSEKSFMFLQLIVGIILLVLTFITTTKIDVRNAQIDLYDTVKYMKNQCNSSEIRNMASEAKSLLRVSQSIDQIRFRIGNEKNDVINSSLLEDYAKDGYLDGLVLLDSKGKVKSQYNGIHIDNDEVLKKIDKKALMDTCTFKEKTYSIRIELEDESHLDIAAVGRDDQEGVIVGYFYTSAKYSQVVNNSISSIVQGFSIKSPCTIVISEGNDIIISNDSSLKGTKVEDTRILKRIMERGTGNKIIHAKNEATRFGNDFGLMDKSRNYYIYAFENERDVFVLTVPAMIGVLIGYLFINILIKMILRKSEKNHQKEQLMIKEAYANTLEIQNEQLEKALDQAKRANEAKSSFLSRMSHDIRTPLNGIVGLIKIDENHFDDLEFVKENHKKMKVAADHLMSLINDVLQMSKLEDGNIILTHESINLNDLSNDIVTIIKERAIEAGLKWKYEKEKSKVIYPWVYGSPVHLRQIFLNIYGNCIKYNRPGGSISTIVDTIDNHDGTCLYRWTISDTGVGMSQDYLQHIFEPFTQEENGARSIYHGTGLGMTIVKELITQMGGTITVKSEKNVGSEFVIAIPLEISSSQIEKTKKEENVDIQGVRILLVEDNELNAEIAMTQLIDKGALVTKANNGKEAVELFQQSPLNSFDTILMDIMMPIMDGIEATKKIRELKREDAQTIPIIAMTANAFKEDAQKCLDAGMNAHLSKPLKIDILAKEIRKQMKE